MRVRVSTSNALFYIQASHDVDTVRFTIRKPDTRVLLILPPSVFLSKYTRSLINDRAPCASLRAEVTLAKGRKLGNGISFSRERKRDKRWSRLTREFVAQRATARREGGLDESGDTRVQGKHNSLPPPDFSILTLQSVPRPRISPPLPAPCRSTRTYTHVYNLNRCTKEDEGEICISREFTYNESVIKIHVALFHGIDARGIGLLRSNLLPRYEGYNASSTLRGRRVRFSSRFSKGRKEKLSLLCIFWRFFLFFFFLNLHTMRVAETRYIHDSSPLDFRISPLETNDLIVNGIGKYYEGG